MTFKNYFRLFEAKVLNFNKKGANKYIYPDEYEPLKDSDTIRVYHGFNDLADLFHVLHQGLSGKERAKRIYSYEYNNNPSGLFVTISLDIAKEFGQFIAEIQTKVSDLEAPVWPGNSYTVQGQMAEYFSSEEDREKKRLENRERAKKSKYSSIRDSDRPELAELLFNSYESQALFKGELNSNSIRAIWVNKNLNISGKFSEYERMKPKEFIKKYYEKEKNKSDYGRIYDRIFKPREQFDLEEFLKRAKEKYNISKQEILDVMMNFDDSSLSHYLWPKQLQDAKKEFEKLK